MPSCQQFDELLAHCADALTFAFSSPGVARGLGERQSRPPNVTLPRKHSDSLHSFGLTGAGYRPVLRPVLLRKPATVSRMAVACLEDELTYPCARVQGQRCMSEVHDFQNLMV